LEILPKIDLVATQSALGEGPHIQARRNLLYMLAASGDVPVRSRDVARLAVRKAALSETLAAIFGERLLRELLRGREKAYIGQEENLRQFKGKLFVPRHILHNTAHRERFFCRFDELLDDTLMNRIFRACCRVLLDLTNQPTTQDTIRHCLLLLDGVSDVTVQDADFDRISINRQNERFEDLIRFCRLLLSGTTPTVQAGATRTFSLLFDMNKVFERFIAAFVHRYMTPRIEGLRLYRQSAGHSKHLMVSAGVGILRLAPDLLMQLAGRLLVMDTKWKLLSRRSARGGVSDADLYQLFAYTRRYGCARSILLYPHVSGLEPRDFDVLDEHERTGPRVLIRHVRLHRNLAEERERLELVSELEAIVREGFQLPTAASLAGPIRMVV
jgi:5-methylcytosine-specific restriction enzyme subunit McrC